MRIVLWILTWLFGVACGLSIASWLLANERIGDAIVFLYTTNIVAIVLLVTLIYVFIKHVRRRKS
ncbi:hypothetical protein ACFO1V_11365 [Daeguia caeni]|uniref:Uncharacterized protein n=1 Tax=Daeguia caeni TaxID=439612 RepID=A0ABV9H8Q7_9HYPH